MKFKIQITSEPYASSAGRKYVFVRYSNGTTKYTAYARYKMEKHLGRMLTKNEHVDHIDENPANDSLRNLQILTPLENIQKSHRKGGSARRGVKALNKWAMSKAGRKAASEANIGEKAHTAKISDKLVVELRLKFAAGKISVQEIAAKYGLSTSGVTSFLKGYTFSHLPHAVDAQLIADRRLEFMKTARRPLTNKQIERYTAERIAGMTVKELAERDGISASVLYKHTKGPDRINRCVEIKAGSIGKHLTQKKRNKIKNSISKSHDNIAIAIKYGVSVTTVRKIRQQCAGLA